jgi:DNA polymerase I-like protein with 3'-5' exonuclease and polymerase domains
MVFLLHDGIWFTCPADDDLVGQAKRVIREVMEGSVDLSVPLVVEFE